MYLLFVIKENEYKIRFIASLKCVQPWQLWSRSQCWLIKPYNSANQTSCDLNRADIATLIWCDLELGEAYSYHDHVYYDLELDTACTDLAVTLIKQTVTLIKHAVTLCQYAVILPKTIYLYLVPVGCDLTQNHLSLICDIEQINGPKSKIRPFDFKGQDLVKVSVKHESVKSSIII